MVDRVGRQQRRQRRAHEPDDGARRRGQINEQRIILISEVSSRLQCDESTLTSRVGRIHNFSSNIHSSALTFDVRLCSRHLKSIGSSFALVTTWVDLV